MSEKKPTVGARTARIRARQLGPFEIGVPLRAGEVVTQEALAGGAAEFLRHVAARGDRSVVPVISPAEYRALVAEEEKRKKAGPERGRGIVSRAVRSTAGKRADLGFYVRSIAEANYARYLDWLLAQGEIAGWLYEPFCFDFPIKRGHRSYQPDFAIWEHGAAAPEAARARLPRQRVVMECHPSWWAETKGWMDATSKTKLRRMAKYYPLEKVVVIGRKELSGYAKKVGGLIAGWERGSAGRRH
jgi:hypothetical protein